MSILSNDRPLVNYTTTRTTSLLDMIISLFVKPQPKVKAVAQYSEEYMNYSLTIGHLPEYEKECWNCRQPLETVKSDTTGNEYCKHCGALQ